LQQRLEAPASFRDPDGFVFESGRRILRLVYPHAAADLRAFLGSGPARAWLADGKLVGSRILEDPSAGELPRQCQGRLPRGALVVEHDPIPFRNFPYEWSPEMLHAAAYLTLELAMAANAEGFTLKDATPYNVMFHGPKPVFLDVLSFRPRQPLEPVWQPYGQFIRTFVLPLLAHRHFGLRLDEILLAHRDGIEPERIWELCPLYRLLWPPFLFSVTIPVLAGWRTGSSAAQRYSIPSARDSEEASFILDRLFARASRLLSRISVRRRRTRSLRYTESTQQLDRAAFAKKEQFLKAALQRWSPATVLDLGCNTGHFSRLAAESGAEVLALDRDQDVVGAVWRTASASRSRILPLVVDIGRPPGACGWHNRECAAFLDRAHGAFDCILMLALMHHLLANEGVSLASILDLAAELTTRFAIVEYIDPADLLFQQVARGRGELHRGVTRESFEDAASQWFQIAATDDVSPTRRMYALERRGPDSCCAAS